MACYWPLRSYVGPVKEKGKINVVWRRAQSNKGEKLFLPCGQCIGCRLEKSRQWALRCLHEASLWEENSFITLTYDDEHVPKDLSLNVNVWQKFIRKLRKYESGKKIRFFHCGEYGETCLNCGKSSQICKQEGCKRWEPSLGRPHYHGLLFNHDFKDKELFTVKDGNRVYTSKELSGLWEKGFCTIGEVNFKTAGYVARYALKKINGDEAVDHYLGRKPEYTTMSRRPGIGKGWYDKFKGDVYPSDGVVVNGIETRPPKYYDYLLDMENPQLFNELKSERKREAKKLEMDNDSFRLPVKEFCKQEQVKNLVREI